jgi:hypothetical protein
MHKASFNAIAAATIGLLAVPLTSASASDYTETLTIGSDPYTGGATQEDYDAMRSIQQGIDDLKQGHDAPDGVSPDDSTEADDSSGH